MEYSLTIESTPDTVSAGSGILLIHPSTAETDRIDTQFLKTDTDHLLIISTRTTAREVRQKLEHYEVDETNATILDTLSVERGYTRRKGENVKYVTTPEDLNSIVEETRRFLESHDGKLRISFDSITEMIYYADEQRARDAVETILDLLAAHDAVGLFHLAEGVHDVELLDEYRTMFDGIIELDENGDITATF